MNRTLRTLAALTAMAMAGLLGVATRTHAQTLVTGSIAGTVTDANGSKLSGVQITVDTGQMDVTNASGYFIITDVLPGTHSVEASLVGYQPVRATNVVVTQELTTTVDLQLAKRTVQRTQTQVVQVPLIRKTVTPTLYTVTSRDEQLVRSQPNNLYQYPGALISQPGIVPDQNGYPTVRGARQNETGYMLDGILVTSPTDGQFATNIVTVGMDRMNVYTGGYRAELGNSIGGIINSVIKTGASIRGAAVEASTGSWDYSSLVYEQGNVEKSGLNWYVSGNFFRTDFEKNHQISGLPVSEDMVAKFVMPVGKNDRATLLYTQGTEHYELPVDDPFTGLPYPGGVRAIHNREWNDNTGEFVTTAPAQDYSVQMYNIGSLTWSHQFSPGSTLSAQGYAWAQHVDFNLLSPWNLTDQHTGSKKAAGKLDYSTSLAKNLQLRLGGEYSNSSPEQRLIFDVSDTFSAILGRPLTVIQHRSSNAGVADLNGYLSTTWTPITQAVLDLGLRYDSRQYRRENTLAGIQNARATTKAADLAVWNKTGAKPKYDGVAPRLGFTYTLDPKTLFKASAGRFYQFAPASYVDRKYYNTPYDEPMPEYGVPDGTNYYVWRNRKVFDVKPEKVDSIDVGVEKQFGNTLGLAVTPFYRRIRDTFDLGTIYDANGNPVPGGTAWTNGAKGHARGVETKLTMRERRGLSGWVTYTYQVAKSTTTASFPGSGAADFAPGAKEHRLDYDQKHTIYVVGQYRKGSFEINPMLELGSGYPWGGVPGDWVTDPNAGQSEADMHYTFNPYTGEKIPILVNGRVQSLDVNPYNTGWHKNLSVTFRLYQGASKTNYWFLQFQNVTRSQDVTARQWSDPGTGSTIGFNPTPRQYIDENGATQTATNGFAEYVPYTRVPPIFVLVGVHKAF